MPVSAYRIFPPHPVKVDQKDGLLDRLLPRWMFHEAPVARFRFLQYKPRRYGVLWQVVGMALRRCAYFLPFIQLFSKPMDGFSLHRTSLPIVLLLGVLGVAVAACSQQPSASVPPLEDRAAAQVASTTAFTFYSHFWLNQHDFLYQQAQEDIEPDEASACLDALPQPQRADWETALAYYRDHMGTRHHRLDDLMVAVRYTLTGVASAPASDTLDTVVALLQQAAPAYQACWWSAHDQRNRTSVTALLPLVEAHEDTVIARLERYYQHPWAEAVMPVDVVSFASWGGANTITEPNHIMMSSINPGYQGFAGFEMVFHESSHTMMGARFGKVAEHLQEASRAYNQRSPRNLWHAILFYTSGKTIQHLLAAEGHDAYNPYVYERGLFVRAWPDFRAPLEQHWQPYLDGAVGLETASRNVVDAIYGQ